jgi:hypothetical protein
MENPEEILPEILSTLFMTTSPATELESLQLIHKQLWLLSSVHPVQDILLTRRPPLSWLDSDQPNRLSNK